MMNPCAELIDEKLLERARKLGVALLCDGVKKAKLDLPNCGCMDAQIMPVERGMFMLGTAMTVETDNGDNFPIHVASYSAPREGYVMVIDGKNYAGKAYFGDLVMGDCDGVCVIPREHLELVLDCAEEKLAYEDKRNETIAQYKEAKAKGEPLPQLAPQWVLDMLKK